MRRSSLVVFAVIAIVLVSFGLSAEIKQSDLDKRVVLTEEAALLSQIDTVSLYLSSDKVKFAPRLTKDRIIEIEMTLLSPDIVSDKTRLKSYAERLAGTFVSVLKERLPNFAPAIAGKFNADKDISFVVNRGSERVPLGTLKGGAWIDSSEAPPLGENPLNEARAEEAGQSLEKHKGQKGCNCPAMRQ